MWMRVLAGEFRNIPGCVRSDYRTAAADSRVTSRMPEVTSVPPYRDTTPTVVDGLSLGTQTGPTAAPLTFPHAPAFQYIPGN